MERKEAWQMLRDLQKSYKAIASGTEDAAGERERYLALQSAVLDAMTESKVRNND